MESKTIGFVPTMGVLHNGHLSLVRAAQRKSDIVIASIFVNPTQFNNLEDLAKYPNTIENDIKALKNEGCDVLFTPDTKEIYGNHTDVKIDLGSITTQLEGKFRTGHFEGVALIVSKLFNIVLFSMLISWFN